MRLLAAAVGSVALTASAALAQDELRFEGGPFDGLAYIRGTTSVSGPSLPNASPVPPDLASAIENLTTALSAGDEGAVNALIASGSPRFCLTDRGLPCDAAPDVRQMSFRDNCHMNTPFYLARYDGSVRLEWICEDRLAYLSFVRVDNEQIAWMTMQSATLPPVVFQPNGTADQNGR